MMKIYDNYQDQGISWSEFEVVNRNYPRVVPFENRTLLNHEWDFHVKVRHNINAGVLDTEQVLDYTYMKDDLVHLNEFRVKRNNERFDFHIENPSDNIYQEHATR